MAADISIEPYSGDFALLLPLLSLSMGMDDLAGVRQLLAIEQAKGTRYLVARQQEATVGLIGVWFDPGHTIAAVEPPQIIDFAVEPSVQRQGIGRSLMRRAVQEVGAAGYDRLWLYTDGNSVRHIAVYRSYGFRLVSAVPDWFGDGTVKAILRLDLAEFRDADRT